MTCRRILASLARQSPGGDSSIGFRRNPISTVLRRAHLVYPNKQGDRCRQQGFDADAALPGKRLPFQALRFSLPLPADKKMQAHMRMRIDMADAAPWVGGQYLDPQLFEKIAPQCIEYRLAAFHFAARKFPIAGIGFSFRALRKRRIPIGLHQNADGDMDRSVLSSRHAISLAKS